MHAAPNQQGLGQAFSALVLSWQLGRFGHALGDERVDISETLKVENYVGAELPDILALADVVVSRSGAGTIAELATLGKPAILIPYPSSAGNEQEHNARYLADADAAVA